MTTDDVCPECGHERTARRRPALLRRLLPGRPAECGEADDDVSGWGTECRCRAPFHGS